MDIQDIVDLEKHPIDRLDSEAGFQLIRQCQTDLEQTGMFNLAGFLKDAAIDKMLDEVAPVFVTSAFSHARRHNIYFDPDIPDVPEDHPVRLEFETSNRTICGDQIENSLLMKLYDWPAFPAFLAAVMGKPALFPMDDRIACANVMAYGEGQALNWHFDRAEFTTTILLKQPESGGLFQYRKDLRSDNNPNYDGVARMLAGEDDELRRMNAKAGTLNVFRGKNTAHRVTPVSGPKDRVIAVFSYFEDPSVSFSDQERLGFYGRAN